MEEHLSAAMGQGEYRGHVLPSIIMIMIIYHTYIIETFSDLVEKICSVLISGAGVQGQDSNLHA